MRKLLLPIVALTALGCVSSKDSSPPGLDSAVVQHSKATRAWNLRSQGVAVGSVIRYESVLGPDRFYFIVRNRHEQDMGLVDALGRAYRNRPFEDEPEWLGSGTVLDGARLILGLGGAVELDETVIGAAFGASSPP